MRAILPPPTMCYYNILNPEGLPRSRTRMELVVHRPWTLWFSPLRTACAEYFHLTPGSDNASFFLPSHFGYFPPFTVYETPQPPASSSPTPILSSLWMVKRCKHLFLPYSHRLSSKFESFFFFFLFLLPGCGLKETKGEGKYTKNTNLYFRVLHCLIIECYDKC